MRTRIYLEGINLDLYEDLDTTFTYVIDDVKEFGSRNTSFSKTITIPGNTVNNKAFGHIFQFGSANDYDSTQPNIGYNFNASASARCIIFIDQIQVFKGSLRLLEITDTAGELEYQCFVFGELGGFIFELGNRRLQDLDFSDYDLTYSIANIKASWDTVNGSGVAFPLIDYGNVSTNKDDFQYKAFRPALYVRDYLERIISGTTYTVQSNFFLTALFDRLAIPHNQKRLTKRSTALLDRVASEQTTIDPAFNIEFETGTYGAFTSANNIVYTYAAAPSNANINLFVNVDSTGFPSEPVDIRIIKNSTTIASQLVDFAGTFNLIVTNEPFNTGDTLRVQLSTNTRGASITYSAEMQATTQTQIDTEVVLGDTIVINDTIPKGIFQRDFFIWILKMFNLLVYESQFDEKTIIISTFDEFTSNDANTALDWTSKIDREKPIKQVPMSELNARFYQYKFKPDNDYYNEEYRKAYNEGYGDFIYDTEFEFSKETDVLEVGFANSVLYQNVGTPKVYPAIYKLSGSTETPMDHVIRIVQLKKLTVAAYDILDNLTVLDSPTAYLYCGHVDDPVTPTNDICFGAPLSLQFTPTGDYPATNIFNTFHSGYIAEITDKNSKLIIAFAYLNTVDIMNLDFSKLVYVDGVLFRLNKVNNYNPIDLGTTEIQLLKVIDL